MIDAPRRLTGANGVHYLTADGSTWILKAEADAWFTALWEIASIPDDNLGQADVADLREKTRRVLGRNGDPKWALV